MGNSTIAPRIPLDVFADNSEDDNLPMIVAPSTYCTARLVCRYWYNVVDVVLPMMSARRMFIRKVVDNDEGHKVYYVMPNGKKHGNMTWAIPHDNRRMPIVNCFYLGGVKLTKNFLNGYKSYITGNEKIHRDPTLTGAIKNVIKYSRDRGSWTTIETRNNYKIQILVRQGDPTNNYSYMSTNDIEMCLEEIPMCDPGRSFSYIDTFLEPIHTEYMGNSSKYQYLLVGRMEYRVVLTTAYNTSMIHQLAKDGVAATIRNFNHDNPREVFAGLLELAERYSWDTAWLTSHYENEIYNYDNKLGDYAEYNENHYRYEREDSHDDYDI